MGACACKTGKGGRSAKGALKQFPAVGKWGSVLWGNSGRQSWIHFRLPRPRGEEAGVLILLLSTVTNAGLPWETITPEHLQPALPSESPRGSSGTCLGKDAADRQRTTREYGGSIDSASAGHSRAHLMSVYGIPPVFGTRDTAGKRDVWSPLLQTCPATWGGRQ